MKPALTKEEWAFRDITLNNGEAGLTYRVSTVDDPQQRSYNEMTFSHRAQYPQVVGSGINSAKRHSLAALCLYNQPFGFSDSDVHDLDICLLGREPIPGTHLARIRDLRDRISALLPPVEKNVI